MFRIRKWNGSLSCANKLHKVAGKELEKGLTDISVVASSVVQSLNFGHGIHFWCNKMDEQFLQTRLIAEGDLMVIFVLAVLWYFTDKQHEEQPAEVVVYQYNVLCGPAVQLSAILVLWVWTSFLSGCQWLSICLQYPSFVVVKEQSVFVKVIQAREGQDEMSSILDRRSTRGKIHQTLELEQTLPTP